MVEQPLRPDLPELVRLRSENASLRSQVEAGKADRERLREECANAVPTNWLDSLLSGNGAPIFPADGQALERLLRAVAKRIRGISLDTPSPGTEEKSDV